MKHLERNPVRKSIRRIGAAILFSVVSLIPVLDAADFSVTSPGFAYTVNSMANNPKLTLVRGRTYTFAISTASNHPFQITGAPSGSVTGNNTSSGTITFAVPTTAVNYAYRCSIHGFGNQIITVDPLPPTIRILNLSVGANIVMTSSGASNWSVIPEFRDSLTTTNWFALTVQTNTFARGTNETICGRPDASNVFIRIKSLPK